MKDNFNHYIFFIFSYNQKNTDTLPKSITYNSDKKKILIYISEETGYTPDFLSSYYYTIFKSYLRNEKFHSNNIYNFPVGYHDDFLELPYINIRNRTNSVFFIGNLNYSRLPLYLQLLTGININSIFYLIFNERIINYLLNIKIIKYLLTLIKFDYKIKDSFIRFTNGFKQGLSGKEYSKKIYDSKIVLCPKGFHSTECFRHYEAMKAGCVIISEKLPSTYLYKDSPIIQVSNWKEGIKIARQLINQDNKLEQLSKKTLEWWNDKCSEEATAKYMINCINSLNRRKP
ncbi:MAG: hypothetical protein FWD28_00055 [Treponema sp.]|nr:hypothetical protein [Treponema sp.]